MTTFFSRSDFIFTRVALVFVGVVYPLASLTPHVDSWVRGGGLAVPGRTNDLGPALTDATGAQGHYSDAVLWRIEDPSTGQRLAAILPALLVTLLVGAAAIFLWRLVATTQRGEPFDRTAVRQLRALGILIMVYGVVHPVLPGLVLFLVFASSSAPSLSATLDFGGLLPVLLGTLVLVLAECFRIGLGLRDDVEGLV